MPVKLTGSSVTAVEQAADNGVQEWRCSFLEASAATSTRRTRKKRDFKRFLVMRAANAKGQGKQPKAKSAKEKARVRLQRPARHIEAIAANFGRSLRGRQLIRQEVGALRALDRSAFASKPLFGDDGMCRMKMPEAHGMSWDRLLKRAPLFFEAEFPSRSRGVFGGQVKAFLDRAKSELQLNPPQRHQFMRLIRELCKTPDPVE